MSSLARQLKYLYLAYLSKPASHRPLYRSIKRHKVRRILEVGIGTAERAQRLIQLASEWSPGERIDYTGIDLFEMRKPGQGAGLPLKEAHKELSASGARIRLLPGDPFSALARMANSLGGQDLVLISADQDRESLAKAWFYVPRVLGEGAEVFLEEPAQGEIPVTLRIVSPEELVKLAAPPTQRRRAA